MNDGATHSLVGIAVPIELTAHCPRWSGGGMTSPVRSAPAVTKLIKHVGRWLNAARPVQVLLCYIRTGDGGATRGWSRGG